MENFRSISNENKENINKEKLGIEFKRILHEKANYYDTELSPINKMVAGEDFDKANRSSFILKSVIEDFINIPEFPESNRKEIWANLARVGFNNPMIEREKYYEAENINEKNNYAEVHNQKFELYKGAVKNLLESLKNVLPEGMYTELLFRNNMFADLLNWVDDNRKKTE